MMKILIADDHAMVRKGLVQILADIPEAIMSSWTIIILQEPQ